MINTQNLSDRAVNLLARWDTLEGGPLGTPACEVDPETAVIVFEDDVATRVSSVEEVEIGLLIMTGQPLTVHEFADAVKDEVRVVIGIANV